MAQLHFGDQEAPRALADFDRDRSSADTQGEGYGSVLGDDKNMSFNPPPPSDDDSSIPVHHQRNDPLTAGKPSPAVSTAFEPFDQAKSEDVGEVSPPARGFGNFEDKQEEAVRPLPPSGYGGQPEDPPPPRDIGEPPIAVHHQRNDPLTAGKPSPVVSTGFEPFDQSKPEDVGEVSPPTRGHGNFENEQEEVVRPLPPSGYGGQPDEAPVLKDDAGYTSLGIEESQDSENSTGVHSEEGNNSTKEREGTAPHESMAKELEDHPAGGGGIAADVPAFKKDTLDFCKGGADDMREREAAPHGGSLGNAEWQQEDSEAGPDQGSSGNALLEQERREAGISPEVLGLNKNESAEREGGVPCQAAMSEEPEYGSATGSRGILDLQSLKGDHEDISETSFRDPRAIDDSMEGDGKDEPRADEPNISEAGHADTSHFTSQIKSPIDDPKQQYAVDDHIQEFDSSKQEDFSALSQELRTDDPRKEEAVISDPKPEYPVDLKQGDSLDNLNQEHCLDDVKEFPGDPIHEDSIARPTRGMDEIGEKEAAPQAGLSGDAEQQEDRREGQSQRSFENSLEQQERGVTPLGALESSKDEQIESGGAAPYQSAFAEGSEGSSALGSREVIDEQPLQEDHVNISEASPEEPISAEDPTGGKSTDEPIPHQPAMIAEEPEGGSAPGSRGIIDVDPSKASTKERNVVDDTVEGNSVNEATPHQSARSEEPGGDCAPGSRGIVDVQSLKEDYLDLSEADEKEPTPAGDSMESSITNEPTPQQSAMAEEPEGGSATESRGIMDVQSLKEDYVDLSEASTKEPDVAEDSLEFNSQSATAEDPECGSVEGSRGIIDVQPMKEDHVALSGAATNEPTSVDESMEVKSTSEPKVDDSIPSDLKEDHLKQKSPVDDPGQEEDFKAGTVTASSLHGSNSVQDSIVESSAVDDRELELAEVAKPEQSKQPQTTDDDIHGCERFQGDDGKEKIIAEEVAHEVSANEGEQEDAAGVAKPESAVDDAEQSKQALISPTDDNACGCERFEGEDGREKVKAEGYNIYTGEPESAVYDAADVIGDEHEKPTHETETDVAVKPQADDDIHGCERFQGDDGKEKIKAEGYNIYSGEPENKVYDSVDVIGNKHEKPTHETEADVAVEPSEDSCAKGEASPEAPGMMEDAPGKAGGFDIQVNEQARSFDTSQENEEPCTEHVSSAEEKDVGHKLDVKDANIEDASLGDNAVNVPAEKAAQESSADEGEQEDAVVAKTPCEEDLSAKSEALPEVQGNVEDVPSGSGSDIQDNEQVRDFDTREEHDEHAEPFTQHVSSAAVKQDAGLKLDDRDFNTADVSRQEEAENVPTDKKTLEFPVANLEQGESAEVDTKPDFAMDDVQQSKQAETCPTGDDIDRCEHFQGDDGREKIKAEGYNIYSGEPEKTVYDVADISDQHEKLPPETEVDAAMKPYEDGESKDKVVPREVGNMEDDVLTKESGFDKQGNEQARDLDTSKEHDEHVEPVEQHVHPPAVEQDAGFKPDARSDIDKKSPYTDVFKIETSDTQQGLGFEPDLKDREDSPAAIGEEVDAADRENAENKPAGEEFPNTEFALTDDYAKVGHNAESSVPPQSKEFDGELSEPSERMGQEEERRPTDEHPLDKPLEPDNVAGQQETFKIEVPKRPPSIQPQHEDMSAANIKSGGVGDDEHQRDDEHQHHDAGPQKKGIFAKIKEKLSPTFASH